MLGCSDVLSPSSVYKTLSGLLTHFRRPVVSPVHQFKMKFCIPKPLVEHLDSIPQGSVIKERGWITTNDLLYVQKKYLRHIPLSILLKGLEPYFDSKPKKRNYSPEFQAQLDKLRLKLEEDEYQQMVNRGKTKLEGDDTYKSPAQVWKEVNSYITNIINVLVTVFAVVWALWTWTSYNPTVFKLHYRVLICFFGGLLALVADVVVLNAFFRKINEAKSKERNKIEIKKVIDTVIIKKKSD